MELTLAVGVDPGGEYVAVGAKAKGVARSGGDCYDITPPLNHALALAVVARGDDSPILGESKDVVAACSDRLEPLPSAGLVEAGGGISGNEKAAVPVEA